MRRNLSNDYIVGLVDGEGSFTVYIKNPQSNKKVEIFSFAVKTQQRVVKEQANNREIDARGFRDK